MDKKNYDGDEVARLLNEELVGHRIVKVNNDTITLDNVRQITIETNQGCGGCFSGWSEIDLTKLPIDNAIMNVEYQQIHDQGEFKIFVYYNNDKVEIDGDDGYGNGFYGGGFWVTVTDIK